MEHNQLILIAFGVVAFAALGFMIYRQMYSDGGSDDDSEISSEGNMNESAVDSDSYYDDSEVYSD